MSKKASIVVGILVVSLISISIFTFLFNKPPLAGISETSSMDADGIKKEETEKKGKVTSFGDIATWEKYENKKYGISILHPSEWAVQSYGDGKQGLEDESVDISWNGNRVTLFPAGKSGSSCSSGEAKGNYERLNIGGYTEEFFVGKSDNERMHGCSTDLNNYPKNWNEKAYIEMNYSTDVSDTVRDIVQSISFLEDTIDSVSLNLYKSRAGVQGKGAVANTSNWLVERSNVVDFSFRHPRDAKIINEGSCYRVEHGLGFVIFFLPVENDDEMRCGAPTGVGVLPDNVDVTDHLTIDGEKYEAPGFHAVMDTKGESFFKPETRYTYDFHHMFNPSKDKNCKNARECGVVLYGIYKEVSAPLGKEIIDSTMNDLRAIVESVNFSIPQKN